MLSVGDSLALPLIFFFPAEAGLSATPFPSVATGSDRVTVDNRDYHHLSRLRVRALMILSNRSSMPVPETHKVRKTQTPCQGLEGRGSHGIQLPARGGPNEEIVDKNCVDGHRVGTCVFLLGPNSSTGDHRTR